MFSLLDSEVSRCLVQVTKSRLRPPSPCRLRDPEYDLSRFKPEEQVRKIYTLAKPTPKPVDPEYDLSRFKPEKQVRKIHTLAKPTPWRPKDPEYDLSKFKPEQQVRKISTGPKPTPPGVTTSLGQEPLPYAAANSFLSPARLPLSSMVCRYVSGKSSRGAPGKPTGGVAGSLPPELSPAQVEAFLQAKPFEEIPGPTAAYQTIPFAGTRLLYYPFTNYKTANMGNMLSKLQATYGPIMRVRIGLDWLVFVENLSDIQHVVRAAEQEDLTKTRPPVKTGPLDRLPKRVEDTALSWLDGGARSQKLRTAVASQLNSSAAVTQHLCDQELIAQDLATNLSLLQDKAQEVQTLCYRYAIESAGQMCFNQRLGLLSEHYFSDGEKQKLVESYRTVVRCLGETQTGTRVLHLLFEDPFAKRFREAKNVVQTWERKLMREATMSAIRDKGVQTLEPKERSLLISLLDDKALAEDEIFDTMHSIMTAGADSMASSLQMLMFSLATNVDKQEKLATEIQQTLGQDGKLTADALQSLDYLKAVVKESIRLHFPMSAGGRVNLSSNIVVSNYLVPAGTTIVVNSRRTAKNPLWFDHPHFFLPERWLGEASKKIPTLAYMPFGFGANHCPSRTFALQELYCAAVKILQRFKVDLPSEFQTGQLETVYSPFRSPKEPLPFIFSPRTPSKPSAKSQSS